jgi:hypothetical protein
MTSLNNIHSDSLWEVKNINKSVNFCVHSLTYWAVIRSHFESIPFSISFPSPDSGFDHSFSFCSSASSCCLVFTISNVLKKINK